MPAFATRIDVLNPILVPPLRARAIADHVAHGAPHRVVVDARGHTLAPDAARARGIRPAVVYVLNNLFTLGAPREYSAVAREQYAGWVAVVYLDGAAS